MFNACLLCAVLNFTYNTTHRRFTRSFHLISRYISLKIRAKFSLNLHNIHHITLNFRRIIPHRFRRKLFFSLSLCKKKLKEHLSSTILMIIFVEFPTSRMEMEAVADIFDRDGDGFIDYKEFVGALRPDREVKSWSFWPNIDTNAMPSFNAL